MNVSRRSTCSSILWGACCLTLLTGSPAHASEPSNESQAASLDETKSGYRLSADGKSIEVLRASDGGGRPSATCPLSATPTRARLSFDGHSLLVTPNGFVPVSALRACGKAPTSVRTVPAAAGMLEDVNATLGLYVALLPVSTQPLAYLAVVGKLGSARNRVSLPGAYVDGKSEAQHQKEAFSYADETGPYAKISKDGRFVAPNGDLDCSRDAYPGIWNLATNHRVVLEGAPENIQESCAALFEVTARR